MHIKMEIRQVALVIADISGYTQFLKLHKTSLLHAEEIISQLLESVIDQATYPLILNKLEGDAALMYAEMGDDHIAASRDVARQAQAFFEVFHTKAYELSNNRSFCPCEACQHILDLRLKVIMHQGSVIFKKIRQFEEMAGENVILVHRLLKNAIPSNEYIVMTEVFYQLAGELSNSRMETHEEVYDDLGRVGLRVFFPIGDK